MVEEVKNSESVQTNGKSESMTANSQSIIGKKRSRKVTNDLLDLSGVF